MYAFVDRPVATLSPSEAFLLAAMRRWAAAHRARRCPSAALMAPFAEAGAHAALRHFNMAMMLLVHDGRHPLSFGSPACCRVGDDEAVLLALWRDLAAGRTAAVDATLALLVSSAMIVPAARAFGHAATTLTGASIGFGAPSVDREEAGR